MTDKYELIIRIREFCTEACPLKRKGRKVKKAEPKHRQAERCPHKKCPLWEFRR